MTSEYPYPGSNPGSDGSSQPDPYEAGPQQRPQYGPDGQLTPFDAFGGPAAPEDEPAPKAAARASVRMPPGLVVSTPPPTDAPPPPPAGRGGVYGGSPAIYGSPAPAEYGQPPQRPEPAEYGQPAQRPEPSTYGQPNQPATYGQPSQPATYGQPSQPATYGQPSQPATYGQPSQPATYGQPNQPQPSTYGSPEPRVYGRPGAPADDEAPMQAPPARAAVPQQRSAGVYGRPAAPELPPLARPEAPQPAAPAWPDQAPQADQPAWQQQGSRPSETPPQFEQHGRRTQGPGGYGSDAPPQRSIAWQDQLQPMTSGPPPMQQPPPQRPMSLPAPADVAVIPIERRSKFRVVGYIVIVLAIVGLGAGALWYTSKTDPPAVGTCVAQSGNVAIGAPCSQAGTYRVMKSVSDVSQCNDYLNQPSLSYTSGGKQVILCLEPAAGAPAAGGTPSGSPSTGASAGSTPSASAS